MKRWLPIGTSLVIFTLLLIFFNQEKDYDMTLRIGENSFIDNVNIVQKKDGVVKLALIAEKAIFINDYDVELNKLSIEFPEKGLTLTANNGIYNIEKRNLKISGNISAYTKDYQIIADTVLWDSAKNEIVSDKKIKIIGKKFFAEGDSIEATADKATLRNNVKAIFYGK
jgi:lipopolysaccharide assembly outer membrane protein LptD (OstA)